MFNPDSPVYDWGGLNHAFFLWINGFHAPWWDQLMLWMTALAAHGNYPDYLAMALLLSYFRPDWLPRRNPVVFAIGYVITGSVVTALKPLLDFPRPLLVFGPQVVHVVGRPEFHHSFPSGHSTFAVLLAASLAPGTPLLLRLFLTVFATLACISRMSLGAHFPADVLGGILLGGGVALITAALLRHLSRWRVAANQ